MEILLYVFSGFLLAYALAKLGRVEYSGPTIVVLEWLSFTGLCLYPILFLLGLLEPGVEGASFLASNVGPPGLMTAVHILAWSAGAALAAWRFEAVKDVREYSGKGEECGGKKFSEIGKRRSDDKFEDWAFCALVAIGLSVYGALFWLVGWDVLFANAARGRSGEFDGFGEAANYLFLKTLAQSCLVALIFVPGQIARKRYGFIALYIIFVIISYLSSISRSTLLLGLVIPSAILLHLGIIRYGLWQIRNFIIVSVIVFFGSIILLFGKGIGFAMSKYIEEGGITEIIDPYQESYNPVISYLRQSEFQWYSVEAGVSHFEENGPFLAKDVPKAIIFGWVPSRWMTDAGMEELDYRARPNDGLAWLNTAKFGFQGATIPPLACGYAAYLFPVAAGFFLAYIKFSLYVRCSRRGSGWSRGGSALLVYALFLFVPSAYPVVFVSVCWVFGALWARRNISLWNESSKG